MRSLIAALLATPLAFATLPANAQGNPSAEQIINSLKPSGNLLLGGTRGIRLAAPGAEAAPSASSAAGQTRLAAAHTTAPAAAEPVAQSAPSVNLTVNFATGSAELTPEAVATLDQLGRALASNDLAAYRFRIEGHTDTVGSKDYNHSLSERRAAAVVNYIAGKYGVQPARLQAVGMGEDGLLVPTPDQTAEPRNRRVQVINLGT